MALTEMPAIVLTSLSIYLLVAATKNEVERLSLALLSALVGGVALGAAFLSRAMALVVLGALPCLLLAGWRRSWRTAAAFALGATAVAGPIMLIWGGLVPPRSVVPVSAASFSANHLMLSVAYAATVMLIVAPGWFALDARFGWGLFGAIFVVNAAFGFVEISVLRSVIAQLPESLGSIVPRLAGSLMGAAAVLFIVCSAKNLYVRRFDPIWLFFSVSMLLLVASPGKVVHQYSSRYTAMAGAMMILASEPFTTSNQWRILRIALGMLVGLASLLSYYFAPVDGP
jgi:hypothetical protein